MKRIFHLLILSVLSSFSLSAWSAQEQPNIFVIFTDDVGTSNLSAYHNGVMSSETPDIDSIARRACYSPITTLNLRVPRVVQPS